jgi:integrase/recombinase XerC
LRKQRYSSRKAQPAGEALSLADLEYQATNWRMDGDVRQLSRGTLDNRQFATDKLLWFLQQQGAERCGSVELRAFFAYLNRAHESPEGRWGDPRNRRPLRPVYTRFFYAYLQAFFNFVVEEGSLDTSPMAVLRSPIARPDQVQPFTKEQQQALRQVARRSQHRRRDEAIVLFLLDTGARASELCSLRMADLDLTSRRCTVLGKGNKHRTLYFGATTTKAIWQYLKEHPRELEGALFISDRGERAGEALTRSGLLQLIRRLGRAAKLEACRCSPHTFRHTFAVEFLRGGGNVFTLKELLGHTTLAMVNRYVSLAQADIENQHRRFSPVDRLKRR